MLGIQIRCGSEHRRLAVKQSDTLNGIDYLEVIPIKESAPDGSHGPPPPLLLVFCFKNIKDLDANNILISGGVRIRDIGIGSAATGPAAKEMIDSLADGLTISEADLNRLLVIQPNNTGDFSPYILRLIKSADESESPPEGFDRLLSGIKFSFKIECLGDYDCLEHKVCPPEILHEPIIDYMAKDYASFRKLMLDRMTAIMPHWKERNPSDSGIMLVELLAYTGDHLSYFQDAVGTEAYLGTAHKRISVRRHARLLDYFSSDGCNARAWVCMEVDEGYDGLIKLRVKTILLTSGTEESNGNGVVEKKILNSKEFSKAVSSGAEIFETMHEISLHRSMNEMHFYTWGDSKCCLPKGATYATIRNDKEDLDKLLKVGDVIIFEEILAPNKSGKLDYLGADSSHRHAVRLTEVTSKFDELTKTRVVDVRWSVKDALPFPLCLWDVDVINEITHEKSAYPVSVARGNVVLVDNGYTIVEDLGVPPEKGNFTPVLALAPVTQSVPFDPLSPASSAFDYDPQQIIPDVQVKEMSALSEEEKTDWNWHCKRDLLASDEYDRDFVVEIDNNSRANIRFGDGKNGAKPQSNSSFAAVYRVGNGRSGNVSAKTITRLASDAENAKKIMNLFNPMAAKGGKDPETMEEIRHYAPAAFRMQKRAVTEQDYVDVLGLHPEVNRAAAMIRWTGSWYTVFVTIDRNNGKEVTDKFRSEIHDFLNKYRLAGYDLEIQKPLFVALDIEIMVCVTPGYFVSEVKKALEESFSSHDLLDGRRGFFHPDNFTFGQPIYISTIYRAAIDVVGVASVTIARFQRWGKKENGELEAGVLKIGSYEIARLDSDPNFPENGKISFVMEGSL